MTSTKSKHIQILRGLAIIAVVMIHTDPDGFSQIFYRPFLNFAVGLFLFISGMLSDSKKWNPFKRSIKVIIPYVLWSFVYVCINNAALIQEEGLYFGFKLFLRSLILANAEGTLYFIPVYCQFTLLIPLIDKMARSKYKYIPFLITPLEIIIMRMLPLITGDCHSLYISFLMNISCLGWFTYFYLGYLLGNNLIQCKKSSKQLFICLIPAVVLQITEGYWWYNMGSPDPGAQLKLSSVLTGVILVLIAYNFFNMEKEYNNKLLKYLGNNSFAIYLSHMIMVNLLTAIPLCSEYLIFPFNTAIVIAFSALFITLCKKIFGKYSKYLGM